MQRKHARRRGKVLLVSNDCTRSVLRKYDLNIVLERKKKKKQETIVWELYGSLGGLIKIFIYLIFYLNFD